MGPRLKLRLSRRIALALTALAGLGVCATGGMPAASARASAPTRIWHVPEPGRGGAAADDSSAYFLSKTHEVIAVDRATGQVRWRRQTLQDEDLVSRVSVLVSGDAVVVGDYNLLAFHRTTGGLRWRFVPADGYGPGVYLGVVHDGVALTGSPSGHVYAVQVESGALRWSTRVATDGNTTVFGPEARGALVAAGYTEFTTPYGGGVVVLAAETGRVLWNRRFPLAADPSLGINWGGGPLFVDDTVIAASGDGRIHAFDVATGDVRWTVAPVSGPSPFPMASNRDFRALAVAGDVLIAGSHTGAIIGYDLATREERWRFLGTRLGSGAFRLDAVDGVAYVPFLNGVLVALGATDGHERWRIGDWTSGFLWPPAVRGEMLFLAGGDGLSALRAPP
jgi:outer membrane protein assembly factor BamB